MRRYWIVGVLAVAVLTRGGWAASSSINPVADAFVDSATSPTDRTNQNFGGAGALGVAGSSAANGSFVSVLRFDTTSTKALFDSSHRTRVDRPHAIMRKNRKGRAAPAGRIDR